MKYLLQLVEPVVISFQRSALLNIYLVTFRFALLDQKRHGKKLVPKPVFTFFYSCSGWNRTSAIDFLRAFGDNIVRLFQSGYLLSISASGGLGFGSYVSLLIAFGRNYFEFQSLCKNRIFIGFANGSSPLVKKSLFRWTKQPRAFEIQIKLL